MASASSVNAAAKAGATLDTLGDAPAQNSLELSAQNSLELSDLGVHGNDSFPLPQSEGMDGIPQLDNEFDGTGFSPRLSTASLASRSGAAAGDGRVSSAPASPSRKRPAPGAMPAPLAPSNGHAHDSESAHASAGGGGGSGGNSGISSRFGRWTQQDDAVLKDAVLRNGDVYALVKRHRFSAPFTEAEVAERWRALLYEDPRQRRASYSGGVGAVAGAAAVAAAMASGDAGADGVPWSVEERKVLQHEIDAAVNAAGSAGVGGNGSGSGGSGGGGVTAAQASLKLDFASILERHRSVFDRIRTKGSLEALYIHMTGGRSTPGGTGGAATSADMHHGTAPWHAHQQHGAGGVLPWAGAHASKRAMQSVAQGASGKHVGGSGEGSSGGTGGVSSVGRGAKGKQETTIKFDVIAPGAGEPWGEEPDEDFRRLVQRLRSVGKTGVLHEDKFERWAQTAVSRWAQMQQLQSRRRRQQQPPPSPQQQKQQLLKQRSAVKVGTSEGSVKVEGADSVVKTSNVTATEVKDIAARGSSSSAPGSAAVADDSASEGGLLAFLDGVPMSSRSSRSNSVDGGDLDFFTAAESMVIEEAGVPQADNQGSIRDDAQAADREVEISKAKVHLRALHAHQLERIRCQTIQMEHALKIEREKGRDARALAWLRGRHVLFVMRSKKVVVGRETECNRVDMDLSQEGFANRVSRRHAVISLKRNCEFYILNTGMRAFDVNGRAVQPGERRKLRNNDLISICGLAFSFEINTALHQKIQKQHRAGNKSTNRDM